MQGIISLRDALHTLDAVDEFGKPVRCSMAFVKKSGEIVELERCYKPTTISQKSSEVSAARIDKVSRKPHHWKNMTRNVVIESSGNIRKFHIRLLVKFNGKKVFF